MKSCFIIMPISVPEKHPDYKLKDHFKQILDHLFLPAVHNAGFKPIPPNSTGGEIIVADIIHHLSTDDMVLCDMSSLNPNVFYELGIRTALNKPVAIIRDSVTPKIPFDTAAINTVSYDFDLRPWNIEKQITSISAHIKDAFEKAGGQNSTWKHFGVQGQAHYSPENATDEDKLDVFSII